MTLGEDNGDGKRILLLVLWAAVMLSLLIMLAGCKTVYVPTPEYHTEYHHTTDSVFHTDSIIDHKTTVIREVDSATMAQYGIKLEQAQRAWLIQSDRLYKEIERLKASKGDTVFIRDSIPYPVFVDKEVPAKLSNWQIFLMTLGKVSIAIIGLVIICSLLKRKLS